jgi:glyoxylase-like metal-dependent hydrolase (beta-lactamase superfamily II)/predicted ester cyclase
MSAAAAARRYFEALAARDAAAAGACWAEHGVDRFGEEVLHGPAGVREYFAGLFAAFPDWRFEVTDLISEGDRVAVHWHARGTFAGAPLQGIEATGARVELRGLDLLRVEDELIVENDAYTDGMQLARQIGLLPPRDSAQEQRLTRVFNTRTRAARRMFIREPERIAEGVWRVRGDLKGGMSVYFVEERGGSVVMFDAGTRSMTRGLAAAGARLGGISRVVLGHSHVDHRGAAPGVGAPVWCHPDEVADAEGDGGVHYQDLDGLPLRARHLYKHVLFPGWDGGPVEVAGTVSEGDRVADFEVVHVPGHAPGLIVLHRSSDGVVLGSDLVYMADSIKLKPVDDPVVPGHWWNFNSEQARESVRKVAALEPKVVWTGHMEQPVTGDVRRRLEAAADRG